MNVGLPPPLSYARNCMHREQRIRSLDLWSLKGIPWAKEVLLSHVAPFLSLHITCVEEKLVELKLSK